MVKKDTLNVAPYFVNDFDDALSQLEDFFCKYREEVREVVELTENELRRYSSKIFLKGWAIETQYNFENKPIAIHFLIDPSFPHSLPRIALRSHDLYLKWTHVENAEGLLCLFPASTTFGSDFVTLAQEVLINAYKYIQEGIESNSHQDFTEELASYWSKGQQKQSRLTSLLQKLDESYQIKALTINDHCFIGNNQKELESWLKNRNELISGAAEYTDSYLFCITQKLTPKQFPNTLASLLDLLENEKSCYRKELEYRIHKFIKNNNAKFPVLLSFPHQDKWILMGCLIRKDVGKVKGFRDKSKPKLILKNPSYFQRVVPAMADYNSINKRNDGVDIRTLSKKSVVILGCGSLGSSIAKLLLQAGLRQLTLVDPDIMSWGNISRHELGADSVSKSKVSELKQQLGSFYPQVEISAIESSWESIPCKENLFYKNHLVVSAIGNWISERALNSYLTKNEIHVPVVYSWLEEYACVGHAVLIKPAKVEDACFACGFTDMGAFQYTVTDFSHKQDSFNTQEVGCGNNFQPYGSIQANPVHSLAAELAIDLLLEEERNSVHRIWLGSSKYIEKYGGKLTNFGLSISNNSPNIKSTIYERKWLRGEKCRNH